MTTITDSAVSNPAPKPLAMVTVHTDSGDVAVPCEPIGDRLAITPAFGMDGDGNTFLAGGFTVTHVPTGNDLVDGPGCIECCRRSAKALIATGVDWGLLTRDNAEEIARSWSPEVREAVTLARLVEFCCDAEDCGPGEGTAETIGQAPEGSEVSA